MSQPVNCPKCGVKLPADAPKGLCPSCLFREATSIFEKPSSVSASREFALTATVIEEPGDKIGPYKLVEKIGEGGCGIVYLAEQEEPVRRRVALKVIKLGMDTKSVIARFEAEGQALALMDHPNIAKVFDAGTTPTGRPYFVMELARGVKITDYCDQQGLSTAERLELFVKVCHAIQHAHQKGIIHRDIKPSNILVTGNDGLAEPKVIDFGIAKATQGRLGGETFFTAFEQFVGTPAYMSPEQAETGGVDIDTRSDIYSLGVLLYEMLTGRTPFDTKELVAGGLEEVRRVIRDKEPARPSTRLTRMETGDLTTTASRRKTDAPKLIRSVRGDLDWIAMKALEKDRARRYPTVNGLAMDIRRHLNSEPITARPPSGRYRVSKFVRRNKFGVAAGIAVGTAVALGLVASIWQAARADRARLEAVANEQKMRRAESNEANERAQAQQLLHDSLIREARATRLARRAGYREEVFKLLRQARKLEVPRLDFDGMRREAVACLGDFAGLTPAMWGGFPAKIKLMRVDPSGRLAAFSLEDGTIQLRQLPGGNEAARFKIGKAVSSLCFSALDGRLLATVASGGGSEDDGLRGAVVRAWSREADGAWNEGKPVVMPGAFAVLTSVKGDFVATADLSSKVVRLVDLKRAEPVCRFAASEGLPEVALSPDGRFFAAAMTDSNTKAGAVLEVWDLRNSDAKPRILEPLASSASAQSLSFSPDSRFLSSLASDEVAIYSTDGFRRLAGFRGESFERPSGISFAPSGPVVGVPVVQQGCIRVWDWSTSEDVALLKEPSQANEALFVPSGKFLLSHGENYARLYQWDMAAERLSLPRHAGGTPGAAFSPDGARIASTGKDRTLRIWDTRTGRMISEVAELPEPGQCAAFSPDGRWLAVAFFLTESIWVRDTLAEKWALKFGSGKPGSVWSAQFSPDGRFLATTTVDGGTNAGVKIWTMERDESAGGEIRLGAKLEKLYRGDYWGLTFAPDGRRAAFAEFGVMGRLFAWDFLDASGPRVLASDRASYVQCEGFSSDGRSVLFLDKNRDVVSLDARGGGRISSFQTVWTNSAPQEANGINLCLSPDGAKLALSSPSGRGVDLWDVRTGRLLYTLPEQQGVVWWLAWSPDSRRLAVSRSDGDTAIWNLDAAESTLSALGLSP
jgi:serine/threonine protein kinase/WD40 repeat protein